MNTRETPGAEVVASGKLRVLIIEDEGLVAMLIEDMLIELGHEIAGVAGRMADAIRLAENGSFNFAILDVNLDGTPSYPVAEILKTRGIPFVFATGYGPKGLDPVHAGIPTLQKPFMRSDLEAALVLPQCAAGRRR
jgi:CheY-like chemotaxis protein